MRVRKLRLVAAVTALTAAAALLPAAPAHADTDVEVLVVDSNVADVAWGGYRYLLSPTTGEPFAAEPWLLCWSGWRDLDESTTEEFRWAIEFPVGGLDAAATITNATLQLRTSNPQGLQDVVVGYAGDGEFQEGDVQPDATLPSVTINQPPSTAAAVYDVTELISQAMIESGWAGFSFSSNDQLHAWDCPGSGAQPILSITYRVDDVDTDGDGVPDSIDACPDTVLPDQFDSDVNGKAADNRFAVNTDGSFVSASGVDSGYTLADTAGCSATQIIAELGLGAGHSRYGITRSALEQWVEQLTTS